MGAFKSDSFHVPFNKKSVGGFIRIGIDDGVTAGRAVSTVGIVVGVVVGITVAILIFFVLISLTKKTKQKCYVCTGVCFGIDRFSPPT
jgi:hypothetical protein